MNKTGMKYGYLVIAVMTMLLTFLPANSSALVRGITGTTVGGTTTFNLTAKAGFITMGEGSIGYMWGYASDDPSLPFCPGGGCFQFPGPTLIVNQGNTVVINLRNLIPTITGNQPANASIVIPGQNVTATGGTPGILTQEAPPDGTTVVTYTFVASQPGTYTYYSGTEPDLQIEMGLVGAIIVRPTPGVDCPPVVKPTAPSNGYAYCIPDAYFDREYLFLLAELDPAIHRLVETGNMALVDITTGHSTAWFMNGRNFPDTMVEPFVSQLPSQPYDTMPLFHPGEKILIRMIGGGRELHPFHTHGVNHLVIARDGRLLKTVASTIIDLPVSDYTTTAVPGETVDAIYGPWTGMKLGWDIYGDPAVNGHTCTNPTGFDPVTFEWCPDHGKPIPVQIPAQSLLQFGPMWGGTPYLGIPGDLPPGHVQQNPQGGVSFMWHSHAERELTTNNIFIGGMATMALILPYTDGNGNPILIP
jgi:FtsP/CotA-like multicopper oxidase with cupredoxin domain